MGGDVWSDTEPLDNIFCRLFGYLWRPLQAHGGHKCRIWGRSHAYLILCQLSELDAAAKWQNSRLLTTCVWDANIMTL